MFKPDNIENEFFLKLGYSFSKSDLKQGKVLISEPFLGDPNFSRTVILLAEYHPEEGAFGFVLNKLTPLNIHDIVEDFPKGDFSFHYGGPVNQETLFFIHTLGAIIPESKEVSPGLYWSGDFNLLKSMVKAGQVAPDQVSFFGGYSGWEKDQLEDELSSRSWILCDLSIDTIMTTPSDQLWRVALKSLGKKFKIMADFPENPGLN
ncbi:MAG: YqgE/AlgH family protein [Salibacteraceae bacterium]